MCLACLSFLICHDITSTYSAVHNVYRIVIIAGPFRMQERQVAEM